MMLCDGMLCEKSLITALERHRSSSEAGLQKPPGTITKFMEVLIKDLRIL